MRAGTRRIWGLVYRHLILYRRSWPRLVEIAYWPTLQLLIWGFTATFFSRANGSPGVGSSGGSAVGSFGGSAAGSFGGSAAGSFGGSATMAGGALIGGVLLWEITLRGQMGVTITFLEDIWSRNLGHVFVSPLRPMELVASLLTVSLVRTIVGLAPAMLIAYLLYSYNILAFGPVLLFFFVNLMVMGWWVALAIVSLLFRYGSGAEGLAWTISFGLTPFACVFYPLSALPVWLQPVALALPPEHIFAGMRAALFEHRIAWDELGLAAFLNLVWMAGAVLLFAGQFRAARIRGALISIGE
jgi:ABC-2 type transport system permease protein